MRSACGSCHLMSGTGHPESADLAGMPLSYLTQQMMDFKSGVRIDVARMNGIAKELSDDEIKEASAWFASLKPRKNNRDRRGRRWCRRRSPDRAACGFVDPAGGTEPTGNRIISVPEDVQPARLRDPNTKFVSYVPPGTLARGKVLVETGRQQEDRRVRHVPWPRPRRAGEHRQDRNRGAAHRGSAPDLSRARALPVQGRKPQRHDVEVDDAGGDEPDRRGHPRDLRVPGVHGSERQIDRCITSSGGRAL